MLRFADRRNGLQDLERPRGGAANPLQRLRRRRQVGAELERSQWHQRDDGQEHAIEGPAAHRGDADQKPAPHGEPGEQDRDSLTDARRARGAGHDTDESGLAVRDAPALGADRAVGGELGCAVQQVDDGHRQVASRGRSLGFGAPREPAGQPGEGGCREDQRGEQDQTGGGQDPPDQPHGSDADDQRDRERRDHPQQHVLQGVDVVDDPSQQVPAAKGGQAGGRERLESLVGARPQIAASDRNAAS